MAEPKQFKLPDAGEGLTEAEIVKWHVQPGDTVTINQMIVEIETAKAVVELPSPYEGVVVGLHAGEGDTVAVGTPIISIDAGDDGAAIPAETAETGETAEAPKKQEAPRAQKEERQPVLVGYGIKTGPTQRRKRKSNATAGAAAAPAAAAPEAPAAPPPPPAAPAPAAPAPPVRPAAPGPRSRALAKPPVRKLAKDLGVDLGTVAPTGPHGTITREDVQSAAASTSAPPTAPATTALVAGEEQRIPIKGVRKHTAAAMVSSAFTAPHVTEFLQVDVTETLAAVRRLRELPEFAEVKVSPLLLVAKALLLAVRRHPLANSHWDEAAQEIVVKPQVNLGIAAATERGLVVPNIKGAQALTLPDLARAIGELTETARAGKATPADLTGGTITISNVGVFGVDTGTPILNPGEVAILAIGQIRDMPWVADGELAVRKVCTLSLSFDHRVIDGELGSKVLRDVGAMLHDPLTMLAWG
ncbi:MAG: 2-oxo acid dehydrogenase subunit E2 [Streptosporangiales bacterium]|nr:2-oxo acid dehydrogenase subunit E2 [Streptosporangiales bacterium]